MDILGNVLMLLLKILVLPIYIIIAFLSLITSLIGGIGKIFLGFLYLPLILIGIIAFMSGTPIWLPLIYCFLFLGILSIIMGFFPFIFKSLFRGVGKFMYFWF